MVEVRSSRDNGTVQRGNVQMVRGDFYVRRVASFLAQRVHKLVALHAEVVEVTPGLLVGQAEWEQPGMDCVCELRVGPVVPVLGLRPEFLRCPGRLSRLTAWRYGVLQYLIY